MKQLLALAFFLFLGAANGLAQQKTETAPATSPIDAIAREAAEKLVKKYALNADQGKEMFAIQQRKLRNMSEIDSLKTSNRSLYLAKLESLQKGTLASIRRSLRTKEQIDLYDKTQKEVRTQRAEKQKEFAGKNASKEDVKAALLEIYIE
jgi:hypothetical protein